MSTAQATSFDVTELLRQLSAALQAGVLKFNGSLLLEEGDKTLEIHATGGELVVDEV